MDATLYFSTARERERIRLKRLAGKKPPWTDDEIFQRFRFCNVHRENDKTTVWFRENVRDPLANTARNLDHKTTALLRIVEATLAFRWFNRIETGEIIKDLLLNGWDTQEARKRLVDVTPIVTGAYMIKTETGLSKLDGVLYAIEKALPQLPAIVKTWGDSIEQATADLCPLMWMGPFLAYEITTDLRWTPVLENAKDIMTWANPGPGCTKGLGRVFDGDQWRWNRAQPKHVAEMLELMAKLLEMSKKDKYWPKEWPQWEMREVEMWACELQKYCTALDGFQKNGKYGKLKRRFRYD